MAFKRAKEWLARLRAQEGAGASAEGVRAVQAPVPLIAAGSCEECAYHRPPARLGERQSVSPSSSPGLCQLRGFAIVAPARTYCKNFSSGEIGTGPQPALRGGIYSIRSERDRTCLPWVGLIAPHEAEGACEVCGRAVENGIRIDLLEGSVLTCGTRHYYQWWSLFMDARLGLVRQAGEKAYSDMCESISPKAARAHRSDAVEAYRGAMAMADDLERPKELAALEGRLQEIEKEFEKRFS